ncbi:hypothetical protein C1H46_035764 [Malus baccata]|uniref:Pentacotripeptide-repeat region of PRORP domain-containing protein n=1 Tax=Malus baccata TaxID=106549 RepID=A0A540KX50_MALBA|nr:hypothetical protein C1H46_035764 [Malus baccata]
MIKLLGSNPRHVNAISGSSRALFCSIEAAASSQPPFEPLYIRISRAGNPRVSVAPILNQWVEEGRDVKKWELQSFIKLFRKYRRYSHALQILLNSYAAISEIDRMEKLLMKIEADPLVNVDWNGYVIAANGFLKAGLLEKASTMLRRSEQLISNKTSKFAYEVLLTLYATIGNKDEVYRIWNMYKNMVGLYNSGYLCMLSSLVKLGDIDSAEMIVEEWESVAKFFDIRIPNLLITAYCKKGLLEKADLYIKRLEESGKELDASIWTRLATGYHMNGQMDKAVETMKKAILASRAGRKFNHLTLAACLEYLKEKGDVEVAQELSRLIRETDHFSADLCDKLDKYVIGELHRRDGEVSQELLRLLTGSDHLSTDLYDKVEDYTYDESKVMALIN